MSNIFGYSKQKDTVNLNGFLPGQKSAVQKVEHQFAVASSVSSALENGLVVKLKADTKGVRRAEPIEASDTADKVVGIVMADLHAQSRYSSLKFGDTQIIYEYVKGSPVTVMTKGKIWVPVQDDGEITAGAEVFIRNVADTTNGRPIGGIETKAVASAVIKLPNAYFTGLVGNPLSNSAKATTSAGKTGRVAEIALDLAIKA